MSSLNDDELNFLLEQVKSKSPQPSTALMARALRTYQTNLAKPSPRRRRLWRPISAPWPVAILIAVLMVLIGILGDKGFRQHSMIASSHDEKVRLAWQNSVDRDRPGAQETSGKTTVILAFKEFQPVREIKPRVLRSMRDGQ